MSGLIMLASRVHQIWPIYFALVLQAEVEALMTAAAREKHSREAQQKKCTELEASLRR